MDPCLAFYNFILGFYETMDIDSQAANAQGLMSLMSYVHLNCANMPTPPIPELKKGPAKPM